MKNYFFGFALSLALTGHCFADELKVRFSGSKPPVLYEENGQLKGCLLYTSGLHILVHCTSGRWLQGETHLAALD